MREEDAETVCNGCLDGGDLWFAMPSLKTKPIIGKKMMSGVDTICRKSKANQTSIFLNSKKDDFPNFTGSSSGLKVQKSSGIGQNEFFHQ